MFNFYLFPGSEKNFQNFFSYYACFWEKNSLFLHLFSKGLNSLFYSVSSGVLSQKYAFMRIFVGLSPRTRHFKIEAHRYVYKNSNYFLVYQKNSQDFFTRGVDFFLLLNRQKSETACLFSCLAV